MRSLVITPKFRRSYRKCRKLTPKLQNHIDEIIHKIQRVTCNEVGRNNQRALRQNA